jgi:isopentenyl diphosphate isomerase/L-lactate dehydrogenase-like FMN-dependent dehydrogenase
VERVIRLLTEEIKRVLIMTGVGSVTEITSSILVRSGYPERVGVVYEQF